MSKLADAFRDKRAFVAYIMAGDPDIETCTQYILEVQAAGADLIELGIPFSDPIAEGEVIQAASVRALSAGVRLKDIFDMVRSLKGQLHVPVAFMTYLNPVFVYGYDRFFQECRDLGICGIIIPDLPFEEQEEVSAVANKYGIEVVTLVAPTSQKRIERIARQAEGFIYLVSSMGVTGVRSKITSDIRGRVQALREVTDLPVAVGFGISTPEQAEEYIGYADGVIVGSAIVKLIGKYGKEAHEPLKSYIKTMKNATLHADKNG